MSAKIETSPDVFTLAQATIQISHGQASCCGVHRDGRAWIGFGYHENDDGREVVAPTIVLFLPTLASAIEWAIAEASRRDLVAEAKNRG